MDRNAWEHWYREAKFTKVCRITRSQILESDWWFLSQSKHRLGVSETKSQGFERKFTTAVKWDRWPCSDNAGVCANSLFTCSVSNAMNYSRQTAQLATTEMATYSKPYSTAMIETTSFTENTNKKSINSAVTRRVNEGILHSRPIHKQTSNSYTQTNM